MGCQGGKKKQADDQEPTKNPSILLKEDKKQDDFKVVLVGN
jgi:hypothetical protein